MGELVNIVLCLSHAIEEYDQLRLLSSLGANVFSIGGYIDPTHPHDDIRPPLDMPSYPELKAAVDAVGGRDPLGAAQSWLPARVLDWADVIIYHHHLHRLFGQWEQIARWRSPNRRVIWRTVGQSVEGNERAAEPFRRDGLEVVRYSPKEANIPGYVGSDALIRFYKDPAEWNGWVGDDEVVLNIAQHDATPHARDEWLNWQFWEDATAGLPRVFAGPHSEKIGGLGKLTTEGMKDLLRHSRAYLYTGTQPASYTLGLIEAMMTGIPVVSIGPAHMTIFPYGPDLFEGHELAGGSDDLEFVRFVLQGFLDDQAAATSEQQRRFAIETFGIDTIREQWRAFLT